MTEITNKSIMIKENKGKHLLKSGNIVIVTMIIALLAAGQIAAPGFAELDHIMTLLSLSAFLGFVALGQTIVIVAGGEGIDLSVGSTISLSCVIASQVIDGQNYNLFLGTAVIVMVGVIIGFINGYGIAYMKLPPLVMTLAMASVIQGFSLVFTGGQPVGRASAILSEIGNGRFGIIPIIMVIWLILALLGIFLMKYSRGGKILYGVGENMTTAELSGINTKLVRVGAYILCSVMAAFAGLMLLGYTGTAYLDIGSAYIMQSIAAVVIGGVALAGGLGSYSGAALGAILLTTLSSILLTLKLGEGGRQLVYGAVLLILLIIYSKRRT